MTLLIIVLILALLWVLAVQGRSSHPGMKELRGWNYAHRGLHGDGAAENSMTAFRLAMENGYGMEFDLHLLKDGNLGVMHDSLLNRTTGQAGRIEDLYTQDLKNYRLENTEDTIPQFADVLTLVDGKVPLIIELKPEDGQPCKARRNGLQDAGGVQGRILHRVLRPPVHCLAAEKPPGHHSRAAFGEFLPGSHRSFGHA